MQPNGEFVVVDGILPLRARRFDRNGVALGEEFEINDAEPMTVYDDRDIAVDEQGDLVVVWSDDFSVEGRRFPVDAKSRCEPPLPTETPTAIVSPTAIPS
jgi:hypothetical protein